MGEEGTEGTVHLLCLAASSGVPLFCRSSRGGAPARQQLPFSVIGSLNGVHMFGQNLEVQLSSAKTENTTVVWKSFHDSITLIVLSSEEGTSELRLERLLQMVFGAMASYRLIDSFLGDSELIGDLTQCVDCVVPPEGSLLQEALSGFAEAAGTAFVSLVVSGRVVAATESWWRLGMPEAVLLPWLVGSLPPQAARDYPVYLPHGSPTVPHRLLTLTLLPGLELCLLCGPRPPLSQLDAQLLERWWQPLLDPLRACLPLGSRALPAGFPLHTDILGLLLLHLELKRCLFTVEPSGDQEPSSEQRRRLFRSFYTLVTATHFPPGEGYLLLRHHFHITDEETGSANKQQSHDSARQAWLPHPHTPAPALQVRALPIVLGGVGVVDSTEPRSGRKSCHIRPVRLRETKEGTWSDTTTPAKTLMDVTKRGGAARGEGGGGGPSGAGAESLLPGVGG
ncbi:protein fuzzy homolog isoform X2 [Delphinapterus leucas]|uniref:Protein fuzzy homolog isoform X2 n=1 Tax=Delphinapterus leucas TaxID=9749 RepID=A0A2Y9PDV1_DELLE|nr:protein fuzzy homolog isoform X2 [Delphinapterus leucas]